MRCYLYTIYLYAPLLAFGQTFHFKQKASFGNIQLHEHLAFWLNQKLQNQTLGWSTINQKLQIDLQNYPWKKSRTQNNHIFSPPLLDWSTSDLVGCIYGIVCVFISPACFYCKFRLSFFSFFFVWFHICIRFFTTT